MSAIQHPDPHRADGGRLLLPDPAAAEEAAAGHAEDHERADPGHRVLLGSGLFGTVVSVGDKQAVLEISPGVELTVLKQAIARVVDRGRRGHVRTRRADDLEAIDEPRRRPDTTSHRRRRPDRQPLPDGADPGEASAEHPSERSVEDPRRDRSGAASTAGPQRDRPAGLTFASCTRTTPTWQRRPAIRAAP